MLDNVSFPPWLVQATGKLVEAAEAAFGPGKGKIKKRWVKKQLKSLLAEHDIPKVPDWLETPLENALVDVVVELCWAFLFAPKATAPSA